MAHSPRPISIRMTCGAARISSLADGGDCEAVLAQSAKAGIDVDALAARLQDEGAKSFVNSWNDLMGVIASKSATLQMAS